MSNIHPKVLAAIEEIDAAVFNGDTFADPDAHAHIIATLARWQQRVNGRPASLPSLWKLAEPDLAKAINLFVRVGIKPKKGETKNEAARAVWLEVARSAFASGVDVGITASAVGNDPRDVVGDGAEATGRKPTADDFTAFTASIAERADVVDPHNRRDWHDLAAGFLIARGVDPGFVTWELTSAFSSENADEVDDALHVIGEMTEPLTPED